MKRIVAVVLILIAGSAWAGVDFQWPPRNMEDVKMLHRLTRDCQAVSRYLFDVSNARKYNRITKQQALDNSDQFGYSLGWDDKEKAKFQKIRIMMINIAFSANSLELDAYAQGTYIDDMCLRHPDAIVQWTPISREE